MYVDDKVRLNHMLDAAREALSFVQSAKREDLDSNRQLSLSLVKCIEIIGEAASKVSAGYREQHPEVPWAIIISTRNRLIHGYFDIDPGLVWSTVTKNLPDLVQSLQPLVDGLE